jgi:peptidoglycan/xylan/chitin deacetylase (PgdA/CDA1 family)
MIPRRLLKDIALKSVRYSGAEGLRDAVWARRGLLPAVVALFHRVTDAIPEDGITISTARFRQIVRSLKNDYRPISLSTLLDCLERKEAWPSRTVVVTFDDGYRCNYEHAAPILAEAGVPATFFVVTDMVGTDRVPSWDEHIRGRVQWMDWPQVRELAAQGFEIGSHTRTHRDLGKIRGAEARQEIFDSRTRLEQELGMKVRSFAYPFGGRQSLLPENRELVIEAGYRCCCSAFGGFVAPSSDLFNVQRIALNSWVTSDSEMHFELCSSAPWRWRRPDGV